MNAPVSGYLFLKAEASAGASISVTSRVISPINSSPVMSKLRIDGRSPSLEPNEILSASLTLYF